MLITIITINYNNIEGLKKTMQSVFSQTYKNIEYVVIDGGSTDESKAYIESNKQHLAHWVSEPDNGVYEAMNKGIDQATGNYLLFLNSGDWLFDNVVIETFIKLKPIEDIVYGDPLMRVNNKWQRLYMPKTMNKIIAITNTLAHQAEFYKRSLFQDGLRYDTSYQVVSDWILTNHAIVFNNCTTRYIDLVVCYFDDPGISSDLKLRIKERKRYLEENFDPLFLKLLRTYRILQKEHDAIKNNILVKGALWMHHKGEKSIHFFKKT